MDDINDKIKKAKTQGIWATMYGEDKWNATHITSLSSKLLHFGDTSIFFQYGWPGPNINIYKYADYGITWALTEEELRLPHHYKPVPHVFKADDNISIVKFKNEKDEDGYYYLHHDEEFAIINECSKDDRYKLASVSGSRSINSDFTKDKYEFVRYANQHDIDVLNGLQIPEDQI